VGLSQAETGSEIVSDDKLDQEHGGNVAKSKHWARQTFDLGKIKDGRSTRKSGGCLVRGGAMGTPYWESGSAFP